MNNGIQGQIDILANFIMAEVPGEPSQNQGAVDTAIRIIRELRAEVELLKSVVKTENAEKTDIVSRNLELRAENERLKLEREVAKEMSRVSQAQVAALKKALYQQHITVQQMRPHLPDKVLDDLNDADAIYNKAMEDTQATADAYEKQIKQPLEAQVAALVATLKFYGYQSEYERNNPGEWENRMSRCWGEPAMSAIKDTQATADAHDAKVREAAIRECLRAVEQIEPYQRGVELSGGSHHQRVMLGLKALLQNEQKEGV